MTGAEFLAWLAKLLGGEVVKAQLGKRGLKAELRILRKALEDSQNRRAELESAAELSLGSRCNATIISRKSFACAARTPSFATG